MFNSEIGRPFLIAPAPWQPKDQGHQGQDVTLTHASIFFDLAKFPHSQLPGGPDGPETLDGIAAGVVVHLDEVARPLSYYFQPCQHLCFNKLCLIVVS